MRSPICSSSTLSGRQESVANVDIDYLSTLFGAGERGEDGGLSYFRNVKDLRAEIDIQRQKVDREIEDMGRASRPTTRR